MPRFYPGRLLFKFCRSRLFFVTLPPFINIQQVRLFIWILLVYWLLGSFFPLGDFSQLASVPVFVQHFRAHQAEAEAPLSLWSFLTQHYLGQPAHQHPDDPMSHQHLPLKSLHDFQWIGTRVVFISIVASPFVALQTPDAPPCTLSEGFRFAVFRPPLTA
jgi:hypothetical protein